MPDEEPIPAPTGARARRPARQHAVRAARYAAALGAARGRALHLHEPGAPRRAANAMPAAMMPRKARCATCRCCSADAARRRHASGCSRTWMPGATAFAWAARAPGSSRMPGCARVAAARRDHRCATARVTLRANVGALSGAKHRWRPPARASCPARKPSGRHPDHMQLRLGPRAVQVPGAAHRADDVVASLHDHRRDVADALDVAQQLIIVLAGSRD